MKQNCKYKCLFFSISAAQLENNEQHFQTSRYTKEEVQSIFFITDNDMLLFLKMFLTIQKKISSNL